MTLRHVCRHYTRSVYVVCLSLLILVGCGRLFTDHFDLRSYEHFTSLKAYHLSFIDDFTEGEGKVWNEESFQAAKGAGDLRFQEALEYVKGKDSKDNLRANAVTYLFTQFQADCDLLIKQAADGDHFFKKVVAEELKAEIEQQYNYAIKGELSRVGADK